MARILVVEDWAHVREGHFPVMFAELAEGLASQGCEVTVLTEQGWALDGTEPRSFEIQELGRLARALRSASDRIPKIPPQRVTRHMGAFVRDASVVLAARRLRRRLGFVDVIMTSNDFNPLVAAVLAGSGRWLLYQLRVRGDLVESTTKDPPDALARWARHCETRRRRRGGWCRIVVNNEPLRQQFSELVPWMDPVVLPSASCAPKDPVPGARRALGLDEDRLIALQFGAPHGLKDPEVVWEAFAEFPGWQLVVAGGGAAQEYRRWRAQRPPTGQPAVLFEGFATHETRETLHAAADLIVLSFKRGVVADSGSLADAVSWGVPVVCSDDCAPGQVVERLGLGGLFTAGDPRALREAVELAPRKLSSAVLDTARSEMSRETIARRHLAALAGDHRLGDGP